MTRNVWQGASWECWAWHNVCGSSSKQQRHQPRSFRPCRCQLSDKRLEATGHISSHTAHTYPATHTHRHTYVCVPQTVSGTATCRTCHIKVYFCRSAMLQQSFGDLLPILDHGAISGRQPCPFFTFPPSTNTQAYTHTGADTHTGAHYTEHIGKSSGAQI